MKIYNHLSNNMHVETFPEVPERFLHLFERLKGDDGFWGGDVVHMLVGRHFPDFRREHLMTLPGMVPWEPGRSIPHEAGVYIQAWPFKIGSVVWTFPTIILTALREHVDHVSAHSFLEEILGYELTRGATPGVWFGPNVVAELMPRRDEENPTKLTITYTDGLEANA